MKRKIKYLLFVIFCNIFIVNVYATSINASAGKSQIQEGQTVKVNITVSSEEALGSWGFSVGYDNSVLQYVNSDLESGLTSIGDGNGSMKNKTYTVTFKGKKAGTGSVSIKSPWVYSWAEKTMKVSTRGASIKVISPNNNSSNTTKSNTTSNKTKNESANNNLSSLSVDKYDLNPKFNKNTISYDISVPNEVREIKVNAKADDSKASVKGTGNIKLNDGKNKVNITVTAENGNRKTYTINVNVKDKNPIIVNIDGEEYNVVQKKEELNSPNNYKETTTTINGTEVPALTSDITNFTLVGLTDKNGKTNLYIYANDKYTLYNEYKFSGINIYLKEPNKDKMLEDLEETEISINDEKVKAYKLKGNTYPLLYGINLENGEENWYTYEESEKTLQKFAVGGKNGSSDAKFVNSKDSNNDKYKYLSIILGGISGILFIFLVIAGIRLSLNKNSSIEDSTLDINDINTDESTKEEIKNDNENNNDNEKNNDTKEEKDIKTEEKNETTDDNIKDTNLEKTNIDIKKSDIDKNKTEN